ncbi:MAG: N-formylglutamate amidohydrolase [Casimicrobium sp.]
MLDFSPVRVLAPPPDVASIPLVLDSPHSGVRYPADFDYTCDFAQLRKAEDTDVDDLYADAPSLGATLVCAEFPRSYIDPNRRVEDVDTSMIDGRWPHKVDHSPKTKSGIGLIWRLLDVDVSIYSRKLAVAEVEARIARYHAPYWAALRNTIEAAFVQHRRVFHLNCHSMPEEAGGLSWVKQGTKFPDIVLGDRDGSTCSMEFTMMLHDAFRDEGMSVAINDPYKGVELVKQFGRPRDDRHSIQIEINRKLYMNEATRERNANYGALKQSLQRILQRTKDFVQNP